MLGAHERIVSLGEVHHLRAYARQDRKLYDPRQPLVCSCGEAFAACPFWNAVEGRLGRPLASLRTALPFTVFRPGPVRRRIRSLVRRWPLYTGGLERDSLALCDAAMAEAGAEIAVDSSKDTVRFRLLKRAAPERVKPLILARDYRATVYSKVRRGRAMEVSARRWGNVMRQLWALKEEQPDALLLRYEDLCTQPEAELRRICSALGVEFRDTMLERPLSTHHLGGSPSKADPGRRYIELDRSWESAFSAAELRRLRDLVGDVADCFGYS